MARSRVFDGGVEAALSGSNSMSPPLAGAFLGSGPADAYAETNTTASAARDALRSKCISSSRGPTARPVIGSCGRRNHRRAGAGCQAEGTRRNTSRLRKVAQMDRPTPRTNVHDTHVCSRSLDCRIRLFIIGPDDFAPSFPRPGIRARERVHE